MRKITKATSATKRKYVNKNGEIRRANGGAKKGMKSHLRMSNEYKNYQQKAPNKRRDNGVPWRVSKLLS